jgi:hypothetical protein
MLCHCTAVVLAQVDTGSFVNFYGLLKVRVLLQPHRDFDHAIATWAPLYFSRDTSFTMQACV